jgi:hypothetical protein
MQLAKSIVLQAGDDESITIDISTECVPVVLADYNVFWELKKTMSSEPLLQKTDMGSELLPPEVTPDIMVDYVENSVTIYLNENETEEFYGEYFQYLYIRNKVNNHKTSILYGTISFMENPNSEYIVVTYTTPELVASQLRITNSDGANMIFTEDTDPKRSLVVDYIRQAEARMDRETRNSWKSNTVTDELHDIGFPLADLPKRDVVVSLRKANVLTWNPDEGDSIWVNQNGTWVDYTDKTIDMQGDTWWIDYTVGQVHFNDFWPWFFSGTNRVKITYRWGNVVDGVPADVTEAATKMVAIRLLQSEFNKIMLYNRSSNPINWNNVIQYWQKDIDKVLASRRRKILATCTR